MWVNKSKKYWMLGMLALIIDESLIFGLKVYLLKSKNYGNKQDARFDKLKWSYNKVAHLIL